MATTVTPPPPRRSPPPGLVLEPAPGSPPPAPASGSRRLGTLARMLLGCVIVFAASIGIGAAFAHDQVNNLVGALDQNKSLKIAPGALATAGWGDAQTLLLVGNDQRAHTTTAPVLPHSNEMLLVRIDPSKPWISMMSIPRELWVPIYPPGQPPVTTRFNYAYTAGGIPLLVSTIKNILGISVNHVIVIDFNNFERAVDEMGCVYTTVDRRYFHVNTPYDQQYQEIDLQPGYQKLCGPGALQFVSYRHGDTSLVRDARDQDFLLDVKKQYGPSLIDSYGKFEQIFGQTVQTDRSLHTDTGILDLLGTLVASAGRPVRQVQFQVNLMPTYDTATPQQISASVSSFLNGTVAIPKKSVAAAALAVHKPSVAARLALVATPSAELTQALAAGSGLTFPLEFPRVSDSLAGPGPVDFNGCPDDNSASTCMRSYELHSPNGTAYDAYTIVQWTGELGQYYDVQGTTWTGAPQFANPEQTVQVGGRTYDLYYQGAHLQVVAWFEHGAVYWIHNTLLDSVGNGEMLAIAEQTTPLNGSALSAARARERLLVVAVPLRAVPSSTGGAVEHVGLLGGVISLLMLPVVGFLWTRRRRELRGLRERLQGLIGREADLLAAARAGAFPLAALQAAAAQASPGHLTSPARLTRAPERRGSRARAVLRIAAALAAVALGALLVDRVVIGHGAQAPSTAGARILRPSVPVAVLNASSASGAAHELATQLHKRGVSIAMTGNLSTALTPGLDILYAPGSRAQAQMLARLLTRPNMQPMTVGVSDAAHGAAVVIVIS